MLCPANMYIYRLDREEPALGMGFGQLKLDDALHAGSKDIELVPY